MKVRNEMYVSMEMNDRMQQLLAKPVTELCQMIIQLEEENQRMKEYRSKLLKIRNILTPEDERRRQGRPSKSEGEII